MPKHVTGLQYMKSTNFVYSLTPSPLCPRNPYSRWGFRNQNVTQETEKQPVVPFPGRHSVSPPCTVCPHIWGVFVRTSYVDAPSHFASPQSLTLGIPIVRIMYDGGGGDDLGSVCLPILVYHPTQAL